MRCIDDAGRADVFSSSFGRVSYREFGRPQHCAKAVWHCEFTQKVDKVIHEERS